MWDFEYNVTTDNFYYSIIRCSTISSHSFLSKGTFSDISRKETTIIYPSLTPPITYCHTLPYNAWTSCEIIDNNIQLKQMATQTCPDFNVWSTSLYPWILVEEINDFLSQGWELVGEVFWLYDLPKFPLANHISICLIDWDMCIFATLYSILEDETNQIRKLTIIRYYHN